MKDISSPHWDRVRDFIRLQRKQNKSWDNERLNPSAEKLQSNIDDGFFSSDLNLDIWRAIIESEKKAETDAQEIIRQLEASSIDATLGPKELPQVRIPQDPQSCWRLFKNYLKDKGDLDDNDLNELEASTFKTLSCLRIENANSTSVKGLVIGHVQSGKTTSMAALMNMAADWGINVFVVMSGRIESLRKQTESRLISDLRSSNRVWSRLQRDYSDPLYDCNFNQFARERYFNVVLKNPTRLRGLLNWLRSYPLALSNIKMLIIDDESDEAGINTNNLNQDDRTTINTLIRDIVHTNSKSVNYVAYTATPYANILNEGPGVDTLYPSDFIRSLRSSNKYFGPKTIFGVDGVTDDSGSASADGLDIIRDISSNKANDEVQIIKEIQTSDQSDIDDAVALCNSVAWFLCATAARRFWGHKSPTTMLVHTSQKQTHHENVAYAIKKWISNQIESRKLIDRCQQVWLEETNRFTYDAFISQFPEYRLTGSINRYPSFDDIKGYIYEISRDITHIPIEENTDQPQFHRGIHLCIDNCLFNGVNNENEHVRLLYPNPALLPVPDFSTAFIVVGGATLSRGLTLQGLVSTYFLRDSSLGDSLLQMGRWFGYRVGYELLPRIWLTSSTKDKFRWLSGVEISLREELKRYEDAGASPADFGPRVKRHPSLSWLRITAKNKMQAAVDVDIDYRGITNQTTMFEDCEEWLESNLNTANVFLNELSQNNIESEIIRSAVVYMDVSFDFIKRFLNHMKFHPRNAVFGNITAFIKWFESVKEGNLFTNWNVVAAGYDMAHEQIPTGENADMWWFTPGGYVRKVNRTQKGKKGHDGGFSIGALLSPKDRLADYNGGDLAPGTPDLEYVQKVRKNNNLDLTPLLVLYRVNKDSKYTGESKMRFDLDAPSDLLGVAIIVPGESNINQAGHVQVQITAPPDEVDI
jgi:hypothetical protein